jgi:hypothetical protein
MGQIVINNGPRSYVWRDSLIIGLTEAVSPEWTITKSFAINNRGEILAVAVNAATGASALVRLSSP